MIKTTFEVEISNLSIDDSYFSFNYKIVKDEEEIASGEFDQDHSWGSDNKGLKDYLENGYAVELALQYITT